MASSPADKNLIFIGKFSRVFRVQHGARENTCPLDAHIPFEVSANIILKAQWTCPKEKAA
jgi:hypothetical protein